MTGLGAQRLRVVAFTTLAPLAQGFDRMLGGMGHRLVGIVTTPGPASRRSDTYLEVVRSARPGVDVIVTNHPKRLPSMLAPLRPDLILCGSFPWRISPEVFALARYGAINGHPGLLPKYRGPNSVGWAFRNGDAELGFCVHRMDAGFDTGPIYNQVTVPILDDDTAEDALRRLFGTGFALYAEAIQRAQAGDPGEAQDESRAGHAPLFTAEQREIDWDRPAREVHNIVRGWHGLGDIPAGAFATLNGRRVLIRRTRLIPDAARVEATPGSVLAERAGELTVQCADGPLGIVQFDVAEAAA
ncbi:MAG: methionyl-tRNA formyltransferase [Chloroflexi bacterium]|nr:MAG: methionyl-tRNA formyltransferase [Chloroflexota bacterium]